VKEQKSIQMDEFISLVDLGMNCKQIAKKMSYSQNWFGKAFKNRFGVYPSVFIHKYMKEKNG